MDIYILQDIYRDFREDELDYDEYNSTFVKTQVCSINQHSMGCVPKIDIVYHLLSLYNFPIPARLFSAFQILSAEPYILKSAVARLLFHVYPGFAPV